MKLDPVKKVQVLVLIYLFILGLRDVTKLKVFSSSLIKLTLQKNSLRDLDQLADFKNLIELNLSENEMYVIPSALPPRNLLLPSCVLITDLISRRFVK